MSFDTVEEKNAVVESVLLSNADHGVLSGWVYLDYGGSGQGFGGHVLYTDKGWKEEPNYAGRFINRVMDICGVTSWDKCAGKAIRVRASHSKVEAIGHIVKDDWFTITEDFD